MHIQWYPGHMTKAMRMMEEEVKLVDSIIYVLDARAVNASLNPSFDKLLNNKTVLYVLNKSDLVEKTHMDIWLKELKSQGKKVLSVNSTASGISNSIVNALREINAEKIDRYKKRGVNRSIRCMVIGIPNCGKSTLINALCGSKRTITGDRPGVTRGKQWVVLAKGIELLDTPGTLAPSFENQEIAKHLAFVGSIKEDIVDLNELALELIGFLKENYSERLMSRYKLDELSDDNIVNLERIAFARGFVLRGGVYDIERAAKAIIDDVRKLRLGKIIYEMPAIKEKTNVDN